MLINLPIYQIMTLWGELVEAYHGVNHYGGNVAELYAYRFQPNNPAARELLSFEGFKKEAEIEAADSLHNILTLFKKEYDCIIKIDGKAFNSWRKSRQRFSYRVHVTVIKK